MLLLSSGELSAAAGGLILMLVLLIVTAVVFSIKFALDIALNKKLKAREEPSPQPRAPLYAIKSEPAPRRNRTKSSRSTYTIVPGDKLFILENPSEKERM